MYSYALRRVINGIYHITQKSRESNAVSPGRYGISHGHDHDMNALIELTNAMKMNAQLRVQDANSDH